VTTRQRAVRRFTIYKSQHPVLTVSDEPGHLYSTAAPPPEGRPAHPFVDAQAYDPYSENELSLILQSSTSFDDFIAQLIRAGYDVASGNSAHPAEMAAPHRIEHAIGLAGVVWAAGGQFTTLQHQPENDGSLGFEHATLTAYREDCAEDMVNALKKTYSFDALRKALQQVDFRLIPIKRYSL
jgi:hypothetical protein